MIFAHLPKKKILLFFGDVFSIFISVVLTFVVRFGSDLSGLAWTFWGLFFSLLIYPAVFYLFDLYDIGTSFKNPKYLLRFFAAIIIGMAFEVCLFFFVPSLKTGRGILLLSAAFVAVLTLLWRQLFEWFLSSVLTGKKKILIVGAGQSGMALYETVKNNPMVDVIGFIDDDSTKWGTINSPAVIGGCTVIDKVVTDRKVDSLVVAITHLKGQDLLRCLLNCKMKGLKIFDMPAFYEEATGKIPVRHVNDSWLVSTPLLGVKKGLYNLKGKRALDVAFSLLGIFLSLPITLLTAVAIKLDSKGPIFYRQKRVGLNDKVFEVIKFRSMTVDAEKGGAVWAAAKDPRITRVGKTIRSLRIDEIPQMWNVLKGEMSFIGPRPERPEFVQVLEEKIPYYSLRHSVKPGITGWAQVNYSYGSSEEDALEKLQYDLFYIKNLFPTLDFHILLKTVKVVLFGKGAR